MHAPLRIRVRVRLALVMMILAAGCRASTPPPVQPRPDAATAAAAEPRCTRDPALLLPAIALSTTLSLTERGGRLAVDGTVTTVEWPGEPPRQHVLADGRVVLDDRYDSRTIYLWDPTTRALTELAHGELLPVAGAGWLIDAGDDTTMRLYDVDPDRTAPRLRELWSTPRDGATTDVVGLLDGAPVIATRAYIVRASRAVFAPTTALICLATSPTAATTVPLAIPPTLAIASRDAIRGHRILLATVGDHAPGHVLAPTATFDVGISLYDLDTDAIRALGTGHGTWTLGTALSHPYVNVEWSDHDRSLPTRGWSESLVNWIDPATEALTITTSR
jgi:hypothetical protein